MLKLYYAPGTISIAVAIALEELGTAYTPTQVDFANGAQGKAPYHGINPKGRVPALETPDGILTETGALLDFVGAALVPDSPFQAAKMREVMYYLASTMHVAHAHKMRGHRWADQQSSFDDMTAKIPETMTECCAFLEDALPLAPFALGTELSLADPYLFMVVGWAPGDGVDLAKFPKLAEFHAMFAARSSVAAVRAKGML